MANKSENADIRELQTQMIDVNKNLDEVKQDVKSLLVKFDEQKNLQAEIDTLRETQKASDERHSAAIEELRKRRNFISVAVPIIASVATALLTFLVISYFTNIGKVTPTPSSTTTSTTTTTNPSRGSSGTPSASATSNASATPANPTDSQTSTDNGGVQVTLPKAQ